MTKIATIWKECAFDLTYDEKTESQIIGDLTEVYAALDDTLAEINMILGSRFVKPLRDEAEKWKKDIIYMSDMVEEWWQVQKNWRYLSNIFKGQDIRTALPEESKLFEQVNRYFLTLMKRTAGLPILIKIARNTVHNTLKDLQKHNEHLDHIQKKLDDYMELKRAAFPRFYFLSSDELIDILANSNNLDVIQGHLKTCFDNIVKLQIEEIDLQGMISNEKEYVPFFKPRFARGNIEKWLNEV